VVELDLRVAGRRDAALMVGQDVDADAAAQEPGEHRAG
jgi:hypothetical protein